MGDCVVGTCLSMCPEKEQRLREKEGLLHVFEMENSTKNSRRPKADPDKIIKSYSRSGAGRMMTEDCSALRPGPILLSTLEYLFTRYLRMIGRIITRSDFDWLFTYEFIFDRLRAIRQDMIIQRLDVSTSIKILEPIVRFHIYAAQRLCERTTEEFIPKFNNQHLLECLKQLLVLYDERDRNAGDPLREQRVQTEAVYILLYLGNYTVLERGLTLPSRYRKTCEVRMALDISLAWYMKNYVRVCRGINKLSPLLRMAALMNLPRIRREEVKLDRSIFFKQFSSNVAVTNGDTPLLPYSLYVALKMNSRKTGVFPLVARVFSNKDRNTFEIMSFAYNSDILHFSGDKFRELLLYDNAEQVSNDCKHFGLNFVNGDICFQKRKFNINKEESCSQSAFSEATLQSLLPNIILK